MIKAVIEIPKDSKYKYEINKETGQLELDRVIAFKYPCCYGFIKNTLAPDGDALDVFIITKEPIPPLTEVKINIQNVFKCEDNGISDDKIIATLDGELIKYFQKHIEDIREFLLNYKVGFEVEAFLNKKAAEAILKKSQDDFILNSIREASKIK